MHRSDCCTQSFFDRHHVDVARDLLGCCLHWDGVGGIIVETEAYAAEHDPACHTSFRPKAREFFQQNTAGTVYVYINYGIHWLLNVLAADGIVLFRAVEPTHGIELMRKRRSQQKLTALCSGPGKLGQALALSARDHGTSLLSQDRHILARPAAGSDHPAILTDCRVGLSSALDRQWRFLIANSAHVSVPAGRAGSRARTSRERS